MILAEFSIDLQIIIVLGKISKTNLAIKLSKSNLPFTDIPTDSCAKHKLKL